MSAFESATRIGQLARYLKTALVHVEQKFGEPYVGAILLVNLEDDQAHIMVTNPSLTEEAVAEAFAKLRADTEDGQ